LKIRSQYNYLKHRGTYYFEGLGDNPSKMMIQLERNGENVDLSIVSREALYIETTKQTLIQFDKEFVKYMQYLIDLLIPKEFVSSKTTLKEMIEAIINYYPNT
jgi:spermidine/putrescine-binding protein